LRESKIQGAMTAIIASLTKKLAANTSISAVAIPANPIKVKRSVSKNCDIKKEIPHRPGKGRTVLFFKKPNTFTSIVCETTLETIEAAVSQGTGEKMIW